MRRPDRCGVIGREGMLWLDSRTRLFQRPLEPCRPGLLLVPTRVWTAADMIIQSATSTVVYQTYSSTPTINLLSELESSRRRYSDEVHQRDRSRIGCARICSPCCAIVRGRAGAVCNVSRSLAPPLPRARELVVSLPPYLSQRRALTPASSRPTPTQTFFTSQAPCALLVDCPNVHSRLVTTAEDS